MSTLTNEVNSVVSDSVSLVRACQRLEGEEGKSLPQIANEIERYITDLKAAVATDSSADT